LKGVYQQHALLQMSIEWEQSQISANAELFTSVIAVKRTTHEGTHYFLTIWDAVNVPFLSLEINRNSQQVYPDQSCRQQYVRTIIAYFCTAGIFVL
jgi:hypothetical protein